jgi:hypothetical protein
VTLFGRSRGDCDTTSPDPGLIVAPVEVTAERCTPHVPLTWLQPPTLAETNTMRPLVGTSFYQSAIPPITRHLGASRPRVELFTVQLALLPDGRYAGTVAVYADGRRVASLPADWSAEYAPTVRALTESGRPATCRAVLAGADTGRDTIGVWALLPSRAAAQVGGPFLPPLTGFRVTVSADTAAALDESVRSRARTFTDRRVGLVDPVSGHVRLAGSVIGEVPAEASTSLEAAAAVAAVGHPVTCQVRLVREPGKMLRVVADLP